MIVFSRWISLTEDTCPMVIKLPPRRFRWCRVTLSRCRTV
jgi:hypothetical protein